MSILFLTLKILTLDTQILPTNCQHTRTLTTLHNMLLLLLCLTTVVQANLQAYHAAFGDFQVELNDKVSLSSDTQNSYTISEDVKEGEILAS